MRHALAALAGGLILAAAAPAAADPGQTTLALVESVVIPRFQAVAKAADRQEAAWTAFCADRRRAPTSALTRAFNELGDAWARVEFAKIGPADAKARAIRFDYWLDRQNVTGKTLASLLASDDPHSRTADAIAAGSVAAQGLPMLERLLYDPDALAELKAAGTDGDRRCEVGRAVAHNLAAMSGDIVADWTGPGGARAALAANTRWGAFFANDAEAARVFLTDLLVGLETLKDGKVPYLFHDEQNPGAPRLAEGARSGRTLRDIRLNFTAIREMLDRFMAPATADQRSMLAAALDRAEASLEAVEAAQKRFPPHAPGRTAAIQTAISAFNDLQQLDIPLVQTATGVTIGLNSLDGD